MKTILIIIGVLAGEMYLCSYHDPFVFAIGNLAAAFIYAHFEREVKESNKIFEQWKIEKENRNDL